MKNQLNNKKGSKIKGKITKNSSPSNSVENLLQISSVMQNKANVKIGKMKLSIVLKKDYEEICGLVR